MTVIGAILGAVGTILGLTYAILGMRAVQHLHHADQIDRAVGWSLWWCFDAARYDDEGQRMCKQGQVLAFLAAGFWIAAYAVQRH